MLKPTTHTIALIIALAAGLIMAVSLFILLHYEVSWANMALTTIAIVALLYFITLAILKKLVINHITAIYKTIYSYEVNKKMLKNKLASNPIEITRKKVEEWVQKKSKEIISLHEDERFRREYIGNVSHELKTPIFNIQGFVLTLLDGALNDPELTRNYLERVDKSVNRLMAIIYDLEAITDLECKGVPLSLEEFNIVKLVDELLEGLEIRAKKQNITLSRDEDFATVMVEADRQRISQVLINLIVNSINYGVDGGRTHVSFTLLPERVLVEVKDNGIGIEEKDISRIFERFYRVHKHRSRGSGGSGLGLSIVKHIIESHEQTINVMSEPGKGSTFAFTLKLADTTNPIRNIFPNSSNGGRN